MSFNLSPHPDYPGAEIATPVQLFENYPKLAGWIEKLANRRIENFSHASWCAFLGELNGALAVAETERDRAREAALILKGDPAAVAIYAALRKERDVALGALREIADEGDAELNALQLLAGCREIARAALSSAKQVVSESSRDTNND